MNESVEAYVVDTVIIPPREKLAEELLEGIRYLVWDYLNTACSYEFVAQDCFVFMESAVVRAVCAAISRVDSGDYNLHEEIMAAAEGFACEWLDWRFPKD